MSIIYIKTSYESCDLFTKPGPVAVLWAMQLLFWGNEVGQCMKMMRFCVCEIVVWLNLQLNPLEFQTAIQWWLGMSFSHHAIVVLGTWLPA